MIQRLKAILGLTPSCDHCGKPVENDAAAIKHSLKDHREHWQKVDRDDVPEDVREELGLDDE